YFILDCERLHTLLYLIERESRSPRRGPTVGQSRVIGGRERPRIADPQELSRAHMTTPAGRRTSRSCRAGIMCAMRVQSFADQEILLDSDLLIAGDNASILARLPV